MKKYAIYLILFLTPFLNKAGSEIPFHNADEKNEIEISNKDKNEAEEKEELYSALHLSEYGLTYNVLQLALKGHQKLKDEGRLANPDILTIVDFSQTSKNKRLYVIDMVNKEVLFNTLVSHGRNTGDEFAQNFSNENGSHKSSLGFYVTKNNNMGSTVGYSLILEGIEKGFNDNAAMRQIIMHGADYATESFIDRTGRLGRSYGCPAVPPELIEPVVEVIENGTCLFIYYPDEHYLDTSPLLN